MDRKVRLDFAGLKAGISIERVIPILGLTMKQEGKTYRGHCPACKSDDKRALAITPEKQAFYCFAAQAGGDIIALVAHIQGTSMWDAAYFLHAHFHPVDTPKAEVIPINRTPPQERQMTYTGGLGSHKCVDAIEICALSKDEAYRRAGNCPLCMDLVDFMIRNREIANLRTPPQEPAPQSAPAAKESPYNGQADNVLTPLSHLVFESEHVQQLGFDAATAVALGIGFASKGMMRGRVAVPLRTDTGKLVGYLGIAPGCDVKLPTSFKF